MTHVLPALPYASNALEPFISAETIDYHYGKHHQAYVTNINNLVPGTEFEDATLEDIVLNSDGGIFNNAAQVWNMEDESFSVIGSSMCYSIFRRPPSRLGGSRAPTATTRSATSHRPEGWPPTSGA